MHIRLSAHPCIHFDIHLRQHVKLIACLFVVLKATEDGEADKSDNCIFTYPARSVIQRQSGRVFCSYSRPTTGHLKLAQSWTVCTMSSSEKCLSRVNPFLDLAGKRFMWCVSLWVFSRERARRCSVVYTTVYENSSPFPKSKF